MRFTSKSSPSPAPRRHRPGAQPAGSAYARQSYAQCGEDLIVSFLLRDILGIRKPTYLDVGAHHPFKLSNTYHFYRQGCRGVCVEPDPDLFEPIRRRRPGDVCLNVGVGTDARSAIDFYVFSVRSLNTFSRALKDEIERAGVYRVRQVRQVDLVPIERIIDDHLRPWPNFLSLDAEGMDLEILRSIDFQKRRPEAICVETLSFTTQRKEPEIGQFMEAVGYLPYADTFINTIYVCRQAWSGRNGAS